VRCVSEIKVSLLSTADNAVPVGYLMGGSTVDIGTVAGRVDTQGFAEMTPLHGVK